MTIPINATEDQVVGGWKIKELLDGKPVKQAGLLEEADKKLLYIDEVNLLDDHIVNIILDVTSTGKLVVQREGRNDKYDVQTTLVGTMNPEEGGLRPQLLDRFGLMVGVEEETRFAQRLQILETVLAFDLALQQEQKEQQDSEFRKQADAESARIKRELKDAKVRYKENFCAEEWYIEMPAHLPSCQLTFKVFYSGAEKRAILAASHTLTIQSDGSLDDEELIYAYQLAARPPDATAIMVITPQADASNSRAFTVRGWSSLKPLREHASSATTVSVEQLMQRKDMPRKILGKIRMFAEKTLPDFKAWLQALYTLYQEKLSLVIIDMTDLEIPWEMFELADWQYIGTMIRVARWLAPSNSRHYPLLIQENMCHEGSSIAYIDGAMGERQTARERTTLERSGQVYSAISRLEEQLYEDLTRIGLIYVGCHGKQGSSLQKLQPEQLAASELAMIDTHPDPRPAAFKKEKETYSKHLGRKIFSITCMRFFIHPPTESVMLNFLKTIFRACR